MYAGFAQNPVISKGVHKMKKLSPNLEKSAQKRAGLSGFQ
jgi:hypothetical protein